MGFPIFAAVLLILGQPALVGPPAPAPIGPPAPAAIGPPAPASAQGDGEEDPPTEDGEMVVRGERYDENSPYRIPRQFRNQRSDDDQHSSWSARVNDEAAMARFGDQTVGPFGYLQAQRQQECQWRAARQEARGERPDCSRGNGQANRPARRNWEEQSGQR